MIKINKVYKDGRNETKTVDEWDFPMLDQFTETLTKMKEENCSNLIINLEDGSVIYTLKESS